ncbi:Senescence regulator S40 [Spatholobus suberectus]|nr:Senescence regulator S40 [Spatholobus suberectus]
MAEGFTESEVVFPDQHHPGGFHEGGVVVEPPQRDQKENNCRGKRVANSAPVNIPERVVRQWSSGEEEAEEEMTPPHEIVRRRVAGKMAFSVCTGNGRTLKGRDLSQVRNSILRLTGFLEA